MRQLHKANSCGDCEGQELEVVEIEGSGLNPDFVNQVNQTLIDDRHIYLSGKIDKTAFIEIKSQILYYNLQDKDIPVAERKPIKLFIDSEGGDVYAGFGIIDAITSSKTKVIGYAESMVMSMALAIFAACHERVTGKNSTFMYHDVQISKFDGAGQDLKDLDKELNRLGRQYDEILLSRSNIDKKKLEEVRKEKRNFYFNGQTAIRMKLADRIE